MRYCTASKEPGNAHGMRLITFRSRRGHLVEFLTNEFKLEPGLIVFLYSRRWEEETCFDTWKNDFSLAKAWGASLAAIENQVRLAIVTSLLVALLLHRRMGQHGVADEKGLRKQDRRQTSATDGTDRPDWSTPIFRYTSKVSRQVLRFFKHCFTNPSRRRSTRPSYGHCCWHTATGHCWAHINRMPYNGLYRIVRFVISMA